MQIYYDIAKKNHSDNAMQIMAPKTPSAKVIENNSNGKDRILTNASP